LPISIRRGLDSSQSGVMSRRELVRMEGRALLFVDAKPAHPTGPSAPSSSPIHYQSIDGTTLIVTREVQKEREEGWYDSNSLPGEGRTYFIHELGEGPFSCSFRLPPYVEHDKATTSSETASSPLSSRSVRRRSFVSL
jgi:hypothetical protein